MKILLYVLAGAWNTSEVDGTGIVGIEEDIRKLNVKLEHIKETKASEYLENPHGDTEEESGDRHYEITDSAGGYAKFYITEHYVDISTELMGAISWEMSKIDRRSDIEEYLRGLNESGNISGWKYEYMMRKPEVMEQLIELFDKLEDCNTPFNSTMDIVVGMVSKEIELNDEVLDFLWEEFSDVLIDDDECILDDFIGFEAGTHREEVWHWFDERYSKGVTYLMFGGGAGGENK